MELLKQLISIPEFAKLRLVGGTSLALQIGHRKSIDIDLFGVLDDSLRLDQLLKPLGKLQIIQKTPHILVCTINGIKVDIVNYSYPWLDNTFLCDAIPLATAKDIAAMKLAAITGRGTKKDFVDLYFLLKEFSLKEMLGFYEDKYADGALFLVLRSLTYFADADIEANPKMLIEITWPQIKETILKAINDYMRSIQ